MSVTDLLANALLASGDSEDNTVGARGFAVIDGFLIDCTVSEDHSYDSEITEYPVESGGTITDNIRPKPVTITLECIVSNAPIGAIRNARLFSSMKPADEAYAHLMLIRDRRKPVPVRTSLRTYEDMALKTLSIPRTSEKGDALFFTVTFQHVEIVENKRTTRVAIPIATGTKRVTKTPIPAKEVNVGALGALYKVYRKDGDYIWYDVDIAGWRYGVIHDAPSGDPSTSRSTWTLLKDRPYGISTREWYFARKSESEYREQITAAYDRKKVLGGENNYDPFSLDLGLGDHGDNFMVVHAIRR